MSRINLIIVATINPDEKEALSYYLEQVGLLYQQVNAKFIQKYKISKASIGEHCPSVVSIMEFPDIAAVNQVFDSPQYQTLVPYRNKAFINVESYISE